MAFEIISIEESDINDLLLNSEKPVIVDFWAPWCGPCHAMQPTLEEVAEIYGADLKLVKINIEDSPKVVERFGARSIPLLVFYSAGEERGRVTGALSKTRLCQFIDSHL